MGHDPDDDSSATTTVAAAATTHAAAPASTGLVILERYEVIRRLAIGGMGEIFLARQRGAAGVSRLVVLKTLRPELAEQPEMLAQFVDEARVAATLSHPNIVAVYEVAELRPPSLPPEATGTHLIAMEYIGGIDLAALMRAASRAGERVPPLVAAALVRDVASGLDFAHQARDDEGRPLHIVHRDVSPQNIMVRSDGVVKLLDFGVAVAANQLHETQGDKLKGKIRYMSPEQLLGEELDARSDEFSLGVVLWELLTGRALFSSNNPLDVFQRILESERQKPSALVDDIAPALEDVLMRMLSRSRDARYARLADVAAAVRAVVDASAGGAAAVEDATRAFVQKLAGAAIADRVRDLRPRVVSFGGVGEVALGDGGGGGGGGGGADGADGQTAETSAMPALAGPFGASELDTSARTKDISGLQGQAKRDGAGENSDVLLAEQSGAVHGSRSLVVVVVGVLPGWSALAERIVNVPMGAFGISRLKSLFFRQLDGIAQRHGGAVVQKGGDSFVLAFGIGAARPDDAARAVEASFEVTRTLETLGPTPLPPAAAAAAVAAAPDAGKGQRKGLNAHIGIATGLAITVSDIDLDVDVGGPGSAGARGIQIGGAVVELAEALAGIARKTGRGVLLSPAVAGVVEGKAQLSSVDVDRGELQGLHGGEGGAGGGVFEALPLSSTAKTGRGRKRKILIADDADVFRRIEEQILRPYDYLFVHARDGAQTIKLAVDEKPDLILLDIQMPVMDGIQVLQFLKRAAPTKDIPVVIVTTIGRAHDEEIVRKGGADAFLTKPVKPGVLVATVEKLLSGSRGEA